MRQALIVAGQAAEAHRQGRVPGATARPSGTVPQWATADTATASQSLAVPGHPPVRPALARGAPALHSLPAISGACSKHLRMRRNLQRSSPLLGARGPWSQQGERALSMKSDWPLQGRPVRLRGSSAGGARSRRQPAGVRRGRHTATPPSCRPQRRTPGHHA
jgi:hypothetical protein